MAKSAKDKWDKTIVEGFAHVNTSNLDNVTLEGAIRYITQ